MLKLKSKIFITGLILFFLAIAIPVNADWTIMVYLAADNNLEAAGLDDFLEMAQVGSSANVDIVVQFDRHGGYSTAYGDWETTKRFYITQGSTPVTANQISDLGETNTGDPQACKDFINWTMTNYPSDHYALIFWDHGDGWLKKSSVSDRSELPEKGACSDETDNGYLYFTTGEFEEIFSYAYGLNGNSKLDIVGFDTCLDGMWENMVASEPYFEYFVGSEMSEWNDGWSYWYFLQELDDANGNLTAKQLADYMVEAYENGDNGSNQSNPSFTGDTLSSIDLSQISALNSAIDALAQELACARASGYSSEIDNARASTFEVDDMYYPDQIELYDFCDRIQAQSVPGSLKTAAINVQTAISTAVSRNFADSDVPKNRGIAIYYSYNNSYNANYNNTHSNVTGTYWDDFLNGGGCPQSVLISHSSHTIDDSSGNGDSIVDPGETINLDVTIINSGINTATNVIGVLSTTDSYVSISQDTSNYPDVIGSGGTSVSVTSYIFSVSAGCPKPHRIPFEMSITADSYTNTFSFNVAVGEIPILLVIDDRGNGFETIWENSLDDAGFTGLYDEAYVAEGADGPDSSTLMSYDLVIWFTGKNWTSTISVTDETNLKTFLDNGGSLLISSEDYLYDRFGDSATSATGFARTYLKVGSFDHDESILRNIGITCDPISEGVDITMSYGAYTNYSDIVNPRTATGAVTMFKDLGNHSTAIRYPEYYNDASYHIIFLPFMFEAVPSADRPGLLKDMIDWLLDNMIISNSDPSSFNLLTPSDGANTQPWSVTFDWQDSTDPDAPCDEVTYKLYYSTYPGCSTPVIVDDLSVSEHTINCGLQPGTSYYWKVEAYDHFGGSYQTSVWDFYTVPNSSPGSFSLSSPSNNESVSNTVDLDWTNSTDPNEPCDTVHYRVRYSTDPGLSVYSEVDNIANSEYQLTGLQRDATYYWKVAAIDSSGLFYETGARSFYVVPNQPPGSFNVTSPVDNAFLEEFPITFNWEAPIDPEGDSLTYELWLSTDITFAGYTSFNGISTNSYKLNDGLTDGKYFWKVWASDGINPAVESTNYLFFDFELARFGKDLDDVRIYPNPANPLTQPIVFDKLPKNGELLIYTLSGELILQFDIEDPEYYWEGLNQNGKLISSGIYIVVIKDSNGNAITKKLAILKK